MFDADDFALKPSLVLKKAIELEMRLLTMPAPRLLALWANTSNIRSIQSKYGYSLNQTVKHYDTEDPWIAFDSHSSKMAFAAFIVGLALHL